MDYSKICEMSTNGYKKMDSDIIQYGTAGFRTKGSLLHHVMFRMGLLAAVRSKLKNAAIGLMITASHNPESDNGIKMVDPAGEMLESSWEEIATNLANADDKDVTSIIQQIIQNYNVPIDVKAKVVLGQDTRKSSPKLAEAAIEGIKAMNCELYNFGIITTPQLHYLLVCINNNKYGDPSLQGYYNKFCNSFKSIRSNEKNNGDYLGEVFLDAANGVGSLAVAEMKKILDPILDIQLFNCGDGALNYLCGADYVKINQKPPANITLQPLKRYISIDGDADRIVYYYSDENNMFHLMDGDRIATLVVQYFQELLKSCKLDLHLGIVQTAYANGGSTEYITKKLKVPVACVETGVKNLHRKAVEYDIGVYFEANGHGTVVFKNEAIEKIKKAAIEKTDIIEENKALTLLNIIDVINQTVGDALSDMLLVETILHSNAWNIVKWRNSYNDLPNKQMKVKVVDRNVITTTDADRHCVTPHGLQEKINVIVSKYPKARSFVRPSGTEDIVRVYVECENEDDVTKLGTEVSIAVYESAGGIGEKPVLL